MPSPESYRRVTELLAKKIDAEISALIAAPADKHDKLVGTITGLKYAKDLVIEEARRNLEDMG